MKRFMGIVLALTCVALTSCGLLPEEETFASAPVIREYAREAFRLAAVERGDIRRLIVSMPPRHGKSHGAHDSRRR